MTQEEFLTKFNLTWDDLDTPGHAGEKETLLGWFNALQSNELNIGALKGYISAMKRSVELDLSKLEDRPTSWFGIIALFFPIYGIIKKWYHDQKVNELSARLRNYVLLEDFLTNPDRAKQQIEVMLQNIANTKGGGEKK